MAEQLLQGLRIIDIGTRIGAPFAATLLADFGAEVIKVEQPGVGDFMRNIGPFEDGYSLWWAVEGRNKKSITLDLRKPEGREVFLRLVEQADAVVENFKPGTLEKWGIGPDVLEGVNPRLILSRVSVYGQEGPYKTRPGLDRNGIAMGGLLHLTGYPDRPPVRPGVIVSDYLTAVFNALSLMMALYHRDAGGGGRGQVIDVALYASIMRILEHTVTAYDRLGIVRERTGNQLANSAPLDNWETLDGQFVSIIAAGDGLFPRFAAMMGREDLLADPRFESLPQRAKNRQEINQIVAQWCRERTAEEIQTRCEEFDVPFARTYDVQDICEDPHIRARGDVVSVDDPELGPTRMQGLHAIFSKTPGDTPKGAPRLGEHNDAVFRDLLGLSDDDLQRLRGAGAI